MKRWMAILVLGGCGAGGSTTPDAMPDARTATTVLLRDDSRQPIAGAEVGWAAPGSSSLNIVVTDANGMSSFDSPDGTLVVAIVEGGARTRGFAALEVLRGSIVQFGPDTRVPPTPHFPQAGEITVIAPAYPAGNVTYAAPVVLDRTGCALLEMDGLTARYLLYPTLSCTGLPQTSFYTATDITTSQVTAFLPVPDVTISAPTTIMPPLAWQAGGSLTVELANLPVGITDAEVRMKLDAVLFQRTVSCQPLTDSAQCVMRAPTAASWRYEATLTGPALGGSAENVQMVFDAEQTDRNTIDVATTLPVLTAVSYDPATATVNWTTNGTVSSLPPDLLVMRGEDNVRQVSWLVYAPGTKTSVRWPAMAPNDLGIRAGDVVRPDTFQLIHTGEPYVSIIRGIEFDNMPVDPDTRVTVSAAYGLPPSPP